MYHGDIRLGDTIDIKFTTRRFTTGAPFTLAGTPSVAAYPGNSTTEITAGITLSVDFDARTGLNNVRVVATGGNGYATATNYTLVITAGTVDSVSVVGECVGSFSIEARSALMPTTAARTLDVSATGEGDANVTQWLGTAVATPSVAGVPEVDLTHIDGLATVGNNATLNLKQLNVVNSAGSAIIASSTGSNGHGIAASGNGTGSGLSAVSGVTGNGIIAIGGATSGDGINASAIGNGSGIEALGGGATQAGILGIGVTNGAGIKGLGGSTGPGILGNGGGTSGPGISALGTSGSPGLLATGGFTGAGIRAEGGLTSGDGIEALAQTNGDGISGTPVGAGNFGLKATLSTDAITADTIAANAIGASELAADAVTEIQAGLATSAALATVQADTDDIQTRLPAALVGGRMDSSIGAVVAAAITAAAFAAGALDAVWATAVRLLTAGTNIVLAKGVGVTGFNDLSAAQVNAEVVDALTVDTYADPAGVPAATATLEAKLSRLYAEAINPLDVTASKKILRNNAGTAQWEKDLADDGVTYTESAGNAP